MDRSYWQEKFWQPWAVLLWHTLRSRPTDWLCHNVIYHQSEGLQRFSKISPKSWTCVDVIFSIRKNLHQSHCVSESELDYEKIDWRCCVENSEHHHQQQQSACQGDSFHFLAHLTVPLLNKTDARGMFETTVL